MGKKITVYMIDGTEYSPSAAASMILGRQGNGLTEWIDSQGKSYKEINKL